MNLQLGKPAVTSWSFWGALIFGLCKLACSMHLIQGTIAGVDACTVLDGLGTGVGGPVFGLGIARKLAALLPDDSPKAPASPAPAPAAPVAVTPTP